MMDLETPVLVLGAGLQGAGVALELSKRGISSTLVEQDEMPLNRASLRNEGKIHLGFIYANDPSRQTALLQLEGALHYRSIVEGWLGDASRWLSLSTPFDYLVAEDSVLAPDALDAHYAAVEARFRERLAADPALDYLGTRPDTLFRRLRDEELAARYDARRLAAGFATRELAVDTARLADAIRRALDADPRITLLCERTVREVGRDGPGFFVAGDGTESSWRIRAAQVVNATWERRAALDRQLGLAPPANLLHRLKYRVIARLPAALRGGPSVSMVLGRYGDVVVRADGTAYLSWYPSALRGWSHDLEPPREWDAACRGEIDPADAREIARGVIAGIGSWYTGMVESEPVLVDAGVVVAIGQSDVDDAGSELHDRTRIGASSRDGYHTVDPGKLTTAPLFAVRTADRVEGLGRTR